MRDISIEMLSDALKLERGPEGARSLSLKVRRKRAPTGKGIAVSFI
jgi:hypothetical protein